MSKRLPTLTDDWLNDTWNIRPIEHAEGELSTFDRLISSAVGRCLEGEKRAKIAESLSYLFGETVSVHMLNAYASEARSVHRISAGRFLALISVTRRFDILDAVLREIGGKALNSEEAKVFRVGKSFVAQLAAARALRADVDAVIP